jgi:peptidase E
MHSLLAICTISLVFGVYSESMIGIGKQVYISSFSGVNCPAFRDIIRDLISPNLESAKSNIKLVYVPTAQYMYNPSSVKSKGDQRRRCRYEAKGKMKLLQRELCSNTAELLELDNQQQNNQKRIEEILDGIDILYVDGGNTFYLQKYLHESQLWASVLPKIQSGSCVYIGASAGAIVAGQSISTAYWKGWDDPNVDEVPWSESRLRGAHLFPTSFFMHYEPASHDILVQEKRVELEGQGNSLTCIANNEALVVSDEGTRSYFFNK